MSLTKDAIQQIQETAIQPSNRVIQEGGRAFIIDNDGLSHEILRESVTGISLNTLTAMADFIKNLDRVPSEYEVPVLYLNIEDPHQVKLYTSLQSDNKRDELAEAIAITPEISFNTFKNVEDLVIELQAKYLPSDDRETLLKVLGNLKEENVKNLGDDGVSQQVVIKQGVASAANVKVPNPVSLAPFRTFHEVKQPESPFVFRMKEGGQGALFEADGQGWKLAAIQNIKEFFKKELAGLDHVVILA